MRAQQPSWVTRQQTIDAFAQGNETLNRCTVVKL